MIALLSFCKVQGRGTGGSGGNGGGDGNSGLEAALTRVGQACNNLTKLKVKVLETMMSNKGAAHQKFVQAHLSGKDAELEALTAEYSTILKTRCTHHREMNCPLALLENILRD